MIETLRGVAAMAFLIANTVAWCVPIYCLGALRAIAKTPGARLKLGTGMFRALNAWVGCAKWMVAALGVSRIDSDLRAAEAELRTDGWFLIVANHQSWADILVLVLAFHGRLPPFKFFTKRALAWVPLLGLALKLLDYPFVRRYGRDRIAQNPALAERDRQETRRACAGFRERPTSVLIFVEGTRFTPAKREAQGSPYQRLLKPKTGGISMVLGELRGELDAVVDATISYPDEAPDFWDFLCGRSPVVTLQARMLPAPADDDDAVRQWIDEIWQRKDAGLVASRR